MANEYAKKQPGMVDDVVIAGNQVHDAILNFQQAVDVLADYGARMRAMSDRLQTVVPTLDNASPTGPIHLPRILRTVDQEIAEATGERKAAAE